MLREKFNALVNKLISMNENELASDIEDIIDSCGKYIDAVNSMEAAITCARFRLEPEAYREYIVRLDVNRRRLHEGVIVSIKILNRLCKMAEIEPIYTGDLESRIEIAEFAMQTVNEMFNTRKL